MRKPNGIVATTDVAHEFTHARASNQSSCEDHWIRAYLKGDERAFEEFHECHFKKMLCFLRECVFRVQTPDAEDLAIELELKVAEGLRNFNPAKATFRVWLYTLARNLKIDYGRKLRRSIKSVQDNNYIPPHSENILPYEVVLVWECLGRIRRKYRDVLILTVMEGFTSKEAAAILSTSEKSIEGAKQRALKELRLLLLPNKAPFQICLETNDEATS